MSSANIFGVINVLNNAIVRLDNEVKALQQNGSPKIEDSTNNLLDLENKIKLFEGFLKDTTSDLDKKVIMECDKKKDMIIQYVENIIQKRFDLMNDNIMRQIKHIQMQINNIEKEILSITPITPITPIIPDHPIPNVPLVASAPLPNTQSKCVSTVPSVNTVPKPSISPLELLESIEKDIPLRRTLDTSDTPATTDTTNTNDITIDMTTPDTTNSDKVIVDKNEKKFVKSSKKKINI